MLATQSPYRIASSQVRQEGECPLLEQPRGVLVEVGQAAVGEQVPVARVQEQLDPLGFGQLTRGGEVLLRPLVALHQVDLRRDSSRPRRRRTPRQEVRR